MADTFRDAQGRDWTVIITGKQLVRARNHGKINIGDIINHATGEVSMDPALVLDLCYYGCEHNSRIASGKVSKDEFLESMIGAALLSALEATGSALAKCFAPPAEKASEENSAAPLAVVKS